MAREHMPSEVDRQHQRAAKTTHQRDFGGMAGGDGMAGAQTRGMDREHQMAASPQKAGDKLGRMSGGMGGTRRQMTTPAKTPEQKKAKPGQT